MHAANSKNVVVNADPAKTVDPAVDLYGGVTAAVARLQNKVHDTFASGTTVSVNATNAVTSYAQSAVDEIISARAKGPDNGCAFDAAGRLSGDTSGPNNRSVLNNL